MRLSGTSRRGAALRPLTSGFLCCAAAGLLAAGPAHASAVRGGQGLLNSSAAGPLKLGVARPAQVRAFAGGPPDRVWKAPYGPVNFSGSLWGYRCPGFVAPDQPCWTLYGFVGGRLTSFSTDSSRFSTRAGTRVGRTLSWVKRHERGSFSGWETQCPGFNLRTPSSVTLVALMDERTNLVQTMYLSESGLQASFSVCGS